MFQGGIVGRATLSTLSQLAFTARPIDKCTIDSSDVGVLVGRRMIADRPIGKCNLPRDGVIRLLKPAWCRRGSASLIGHAAWPFNERPHRIGRRLSSLCVCEQLVSSSGRPPAVHRDQTLALSRLDRCPTASTRNFQRRSEHRCLRCRKFNWASTTVTVWVSSVNAAICFHVVRDKHVDWLGKHAKCIINGNVTWTKVLVRLNPANSDLACAEFCLLRLAEGRKEIACQYESLCHQHHQALHHKNTNGLSICTLCPKNAPGLTCCNLAKT